MQPMLFPGIDKAMRKNCGITIRTIFNLGQVPYYLG